MQNQNWEDWEQLAPKVIIISTVVGIIWKGSSKLVDLFFWLFGKLIIATLRRNTKDYKTLGKAVWENELLSVSNNERMFLKLLEGVDLITQTMESMRDELNKYREVQRSDGREIAKLSGKVEVIKE